MRLSQDNSGNNDSLSLSFWDVSYILIKTWSLFACYRIQWRKRVICWLSFPRWGIVNHLKCRIFLNLKNQIGRIQYLQFSCLRKHLFHSWHYKIRIILALHSWFLFLSSYLWSFSYRIVRRRRTLELMLRVKVTPIRCPNYSFFRCTH